MFKKVDRQKVRRRKHLKIRKRINGTASKPRLSLYRSNKNIFAQIIDDVNAVTLVSASTIDKELRAEVTNGGNVEAAKIVGKKIAERALAKGITEVVFDRSGYIYTGKVKALADAAREAGLKF
ncbi:large subunit ribosomal protein L18 [Hypnocyclicus thermotrophus]|uniref:Large ribosomal subunit protein uL18 n=1 Tax=Hypnocyclicus thermotrophus TaxID=1627895 RepID=A0AA46DYV5_9FUSO|nr:50S ribosomal protein L18 [Hypnocyclicus thermotrophus]TDT70663.1 large subunit ribosomal protein L18 [Hypnocyclicus thermotrophus]